jgi:septal ring factor EnvC (AmiA/AmiB activator)
LSDPDKLFIQVGVVAIILVLLMFVFLFYKLDQVDKEYEELRKKKREIEMAARRVELKKKKEESLAELLKRQEEMNRWKTRK